MENKSSFRSSTSLEMRSAITIVQILWERPDITKEIADYQDSTSQKGTSRFTLEEIRWCKIAEKVVKLTESFNLPFRLLIHLQDIVVFTAKNIYLLFYPWTDYRIKFKLEYRRIEKFYFRDDGLINESKIYQDWKKDTPNDDDSRSKMISYLLAFLSSDSEFYNQESLEEIINVIRGHDWGQTLEINTLDEAIAILITWYMAIGNVPNFRDFLDFFRIYYSYFVLNLVHLLFFNFGTCAFLKIVDYLYWKLDANYKDIKVIEAAEKCVGNFIFFASVDSYYEQKVQMIIYLFRKMSNDQKIAFLLQHIFKLFDIFLTTWTNQQFCLEIFDYVEDIMPMNDKISLLEITYDHLVKSSSFKLHDSLFNFNTRRVIKKLLRKISEDEKLNFFVPDESSKFFKLFKISDFSSIKTIMNDLDLKKHRKKLLDLNTQLTDYILQANNFEGIRTQLNEYIKELGFCNCDQDKLFQFFIEPDLLYSLVRLGRFDVAHDVLNWQCDSEEKLVMRIKVVRKCLDHISIYSKFLENFDYCLAQKYLQFLDVGEDDDEFKKFKTLISSPEFHCEKFFFIWTKSFAVSNFDSSEAAIECNKFLLNFCKTEDEIKEFKDEIVMETENCANLFCVTVLKLLINNSNPKERVTNNNYRLWLKLTDQINFNVALNKAFSFCSVSDDKINETKKNIKDDIDRWFEMFTANAFEFLIFNSLIEWLGFEEEQKKSVLKKFIESEKGGILCFKIIGSENKSSIIKAAKKILLHWVRQHGDIEKVIEVIRGIEKEPDNDGLDLLDDKLYIFMY